MSSKKGKSKSSSRKGGAEAMQSFDQRTMQEFKEAFGVMDVNKDGVIDKGDLRSIYAELGQIAPDSQLDEMIKEAPGTLDFTTFLTLFGDKLTGTDPEDVIIGAFQMFDKRDTGVIAEEQLIKILQNKKGEPLNEEEIEGMYKGNPPVTNGDVDYKAFAKLITTGAQEELAKE